jgi:hypothetical protein
MLHTLAAQSLAAPPSFGLPGVFESFAAFLGWGLALLALVLPSVALAFRSHQIFGHWTRFFAQWHRRSWWGMVVGSLVFAVGIVFLLGALPVWQTHWHTWYTALQTQRPQDGVALGWLSQTHAGLVSLLQTAATVLLLAGVAALAVCVRHLWQHVLVRRRAVIATNDWLMVPPDPPALSDSSFP